MKHVLRSRIVALAAVLIVTVSGVLFAKHMAPDAATADPAYQEMLAWGIGASDYCGDLPGGEDHHCPFCRLLADPPQVRAPEGAQIVAFDITWSLFHDQFRPFARQYPVDAARAPPVLS